MRKEVKEEENVERGRENCANSKKSSFIEKYALCFLFLSPSLSKSLSPHLLFLSFSRVTLPLHQLVISLGNRAHVSRTHSSLPPRRRTSLDAHTGTSPSARPTCFARALHRRLVREFCVKYAVATVTRESSLAFHTALRVSARARFPHSSFARKYDLSLSNSSLFLSSRRKRNLASRRDTYISAVRRRRGSISRLCRAAAAFVPGKMRRDFCINNPTRIHRAESILLLSSFRRAALLRSAP